MDTENDRPGIKGIQKFNVHIKFSDVDLAKLVIEKYVDEAE